MKKATLIATFALAAVTLIGAFATAASAYPSQTSRCTPGCHAAGAGATIAASLESTTATTATYNVAMTGSAGSGWAVFDGTTRVAGATTTTGTFTVDLGKTYDVFAVDGATPWNAATTSVSPAAPSIVPTASLDETVPPVTTCDAVAAYTGTATIQLSASDGAGRGVTYIYYRIDNQFVHLFTVGVVSQTSVSIPAPIIGTATHTIVFWSQDMAGNVEAHNTKTFTVTAPPLPVVKKAATVTTPYAPSSVRHGSAFTSYGYLKPRHTAGTYAVTLYCYRYQSGSYVLRKTVKAKAANYSSYSKYSVRMSLPYTGKWKVRAVHASDALHLTSYSSYRYVNVR